MSADVDDVLGAILARLQAQGLRLGDLAIPACKAKQPHQEDSTEARTQLTVCAAQKPKDVRRLTSLHDLHAFRAQVVLWTPGDRDRTRNLPELASIEAAVQQAFNDKSAELSAIDDGLLDVRAETGTFLDRAAYLAQWDVLATDVTVEIVRLRP